MKTWRWLLIGFAIALGYLVAAPLAAQQPPGCDEFERFPYTGHSVCDEFLHFFNLHGGLRIFGYPISERITENGRPVQYFQRVRMDYSPELFGNTSIQLAPLGEYLAPEAFKPPISASERPKSNDPAHRFFPETGHTVAHAFLSFFENNGDLAVFGYPVTEYINQDGRIVQYFQHALMEWDPNRRGIVLHNIGEMWYSRSTDQDRNLALRQLQSDRAVTNLRVVASVRNAFTGRVDEQTVWVYVYDQNDIPVEGAAVTLVAPFWPGNGWLELPPTDAQGHTQQTFPVQDLTPGELIVVDAVAEYDGLSTRAGAFFFSWW